MPLSTPTTDDLSTTIEGQLEASFSQTIPLLPKAFSRVLSKVLAGVVVLAYKYAGFIFLQMFVAHATWNETEVNGKKIRPLVEWGRMLGVGDPNEAVAAELVLNVTVTSQEGSLAAGSQLLRQDTGVLYQSVAAVPLDDATVEVTVIASSDPEGGGGRGAVGNLEDDAELEFVNPLPNVATVATVDSTAVTGTDGETEEDYRARVLGRSQAKPQGGAYADYRSWASEVDGVEAVYPYTGDPGFVDVYVEADEALDVDGIPDSTLLDAVRDNIELDVDGLASQRPASARVQVLPIVRQALDVVVGGLAADDDDVTRAAIESGLDEYLRSLEPYIVGLSFLPRQDRVTQGAVAGVVHELASSEGATISSVTLQLSGSSINVFALTLGTKAKLGTVTYE